MKELESVKKVETGVANDVEVARVNGQKKIKDVQKKREEIIGSAMNKAEVESKKMISKSVTDAEKKGIVIMRQAGFDMENIEKRAKKNIKKATLLVVNNITGV